MVSPTTVQRLRGLILSAVDLKNMTSWPEALIEDYLNIIDSLIIVADTLDAETDKNLDSQIYSAPVNKNFESRIIEIERKLLAIESTKSYDKEIEALTNASHAFFTPKEFDDKIKDLRILIETLSFSELKVSIPVHFGYFDAVPERASVSNWLGGITELATAQPLDSVPTDLPVSKGIGKVLIIINAGTDLSGEITVTGETIDKATGASTPGDTETITVDALTTDTSSVDSNGNIVWGFSGAYITSKWFTGAVVLSTTNLTLTDVDVYDISFEQANDQIRLVLNTFDVNIFTTNVTAEFDCYLYTIKVTGNKCNITNQADLHVGADGETAIANRYWRLRRNNLAIPLDGKTDGVWVDVHYANSPVYVEDVTISIWLTKLLVIR